MTAQRQLAMKPDYSPREFGERLDPPRSGQWVLVRIWDGQLDATRAGNGWRLTHNELRRVLGRDLETPGHDDDVSSERDDKLRELRLCMADVDVKMARMRQLVAELDG